MDKKVYIITNFNPMPYLRKSINHYLNMNKIFIINYYNDILIEEHNLNNAEKIIIFLRIEEFLYNCNNKISNYYIELCDNLYSAHRRARLGKRWKKEVIEFEMNLSENLWKLHYDLKYKKYKPDGYHTFKIYDPKERVIQATSYRDRILQHALCDCYLLPLLERHLIYDNCACRKGKGTRHAICRLKEFMRKFFYLYHNNGYIIKYDIKKYFPNIDHLLLKNKLKQIIHNEDILWVLFTIIDSFSSDSGKGLPMGNQTSQCFALLYLDSLDRYIKETKRIKYYIRYMDDGVLFVNDKKEAKNILSKIKIIVEENKLSLNPKSQIIKYKNGFSFLGWTFYQTDTGGIIRKIEYRNKLFRNLKIDYKDLLMSYNSYLSHYKGINSIQKRINILLNLPL